MSNEMTIALFHSEWGIQNDDYLQHYGILGMHWGIRRYQPYGEGGYDPDHEGKNIGLAARLAGHTGSYSDAIKRGSSFGNRAKAAASSFGKRAGKAASEAVERFNYASDRTAQGILNAGRKAKSSLARYASTERINGHSIEDNKYRNLLESSGFGTLAKGVGIQLKADARRGINSIKHTSFDDVKSALGSGASRFQEAMSRTAVKSKEFGRNAAMTAALFGGALDPRSNASQTINSRFATGGQAKTASAFRKDYSGTAPGSQFSTIRDLVEPKSAAKQRTWDSRAAIRTQMLTDLGSGRNLGKNRGPLSRQSSYDSARQRDLIRSAGRTANNGLFEIGDRINALTGETVKKEAKPFQNRRQYIGSSDSGYGGDSRYDLNNGLSQAREILLQPMSVKNPYRQAFNVNELDRAKSTVERLFKDMERAESTRKMGSIHTDPYIARTLGIGRK